MPDLTPFMASKNVTCQFEKPEESALTVELQSDEWIRLSLKDELQIVRPTTGNRLQRVRQRTEDVESAVDALGQLDLFQFRIEHCFPKRAV